MQLSKWKVELPGHAEGVQLRFPLGLHFAGAVLLPLIRYPAAQLITIRGFIGRGDVQGMMFGGIGFGMGKAALPGEGVAVAPDHAEGVETGNLVLGEAAFLALTGTDAAKAAEISLTAEEVRELETLADTLHIDAVRMWEKEMK